jgi:hypothetical protein
MGERPQLKKSYDTVIVGGGLHGLATAYYLGTRHGITEVAIIEKNILVSVVPAGIRLLSVPISGPRKMCLYIRKHLICGR